MQSAGSTASPVPWICRVLLERLRYWGVQLGAAIVYEGAGCTAACMSRSWWHLLQLPMNAFQTPGPAHSSTLQAAFFFPCARGKPNPTATAQGAVPPRQAARGAAAQETGGGAGVAGGGETAPAQGRAHSTQAVSCSLGAYMQCPAVLLSCGCVRQSSQAHSCGACASALLSCCVIAQGRGHSTQAVSHALGVYLQCLAVL
eukprot:1139095-Pelagomonas_calceolata.AAC.3